MYTPKEEKEDKKLATEKAKPPKQEGYVTMNSEVNKRNLAPYSELEKACLKNINTKIDELKSEAFNLRPGELVRQEQLDILFEKIGIVKLAANPSRIEEIEHNGRAHHQEPALAY